MSITCFHLMLMLSTSCNMREEHTFFLCPIHKPYTHGIVYFPMTLFSDSLHELICRHTCVVQDKRLGMGRHNGVEIRHSRVLLHLAVSSLGILSGCLFVTMKCMSPSATWQEPHCDLLWTSDSAKSIVCHSQWIKSDSRCQIIQLRVTLLQYFHNYFRDAGLYFLRFFYILNREKDVL